MEYGLQLYSVRDVTEKNLADTLEKVAKQGYRYVEFAGFFSHSAEEVKQMLDKNGLKVCGAHLGWEPIKEDTEGTIAYHQTIGNKNLVVPWADLSTKEKVDAFIQIMNELQPKVEAAGMTLQYHNHDFEFLPNQDGIVPYDEIVKRTNLLLEIDTYWVYAAKKDPIQLMEQLKDRVQIIHIKDGDPNGEGYPLGKGTAPVKAVWEKAKELNMLMIVESETLNPDGLTEAQICIDYLNDLEA